MQKLGLLVGEDNWQFVDEICADLSVHFCISKFNWNRFRAPVLNERINQWSIQRRLRWMLRTNGVCFFEWASGLLAVASNLPKHCPIVTRLHSFELYEWAPRINWKSVDKVILVSQNMRRLFSEKYPDQANKTVVIYNGVRTDKFLPIRKHPRFTLGMLCGLLPIKRIYEVVLMFKSLRNIYPQAVLKIGGQADPGEFRYAASLHRLVEMLDLRESVIFDGQVQDAPRWFQTIDVFISNSFWEGQQVALLEAMASGCHSLAHCWAGVEEVLPKENIYITEHELRNKIGEYFEMSESQKEAARQHLREIACDKFDIRRTRMEIMQLIETMCP